MALAVVALCCGAARAEFGGLPGYAGSRSCQECHPDIYKQWKLTPHARMLVNAERDPSAIYADVFNDEIPFTKDDIAYTVGSHWIQKYLTRIDDVLRPARAATVVFVHDHARGGRASFPSDRVRQDDR